MSKERKSPFADNIDPDEFASTGRSPKKRPDPDKTAELSRDAGFSRDAQPKKQKRRIASRARSPFRYAFSARISPEAADCIYDVAEQQEWTLGEVMEEATKLLEEKYLKS